MLNQYKPQQLNLNGNVIHPNMFTPKWYVYFSDALPLQSASMTYRKISNISRTKSQNLNVTRPTL